MTAELIDPDSTLEFTRDVAVEYAALVDLAENARKAMDTGRWLIGDYVRKLITDFSAYAECTVERFADAIQLSHTSAYEYASMASFYTLKDREELSELKLSYSHYREARRLKTMDKAIEFLKTIALNRWTIQQTRDALKSLKQMGHTVAQTYSDSPPMTTYSNEAVYPGRNLWQVAATIKVDKKGIYIQCERPPYDFDPEKQYEVIFREILE